MSTIAQDERTAAELARGQGRALLLDSPIRRPFEDAGELVSFMLRAVREIPTAVRLYPDEIVRQAGLFIRSNALVVFFMMFMLGALIGVTGTFLFESIGLESYVGNIPAVPMMRGVAQIVFGWILAAKAGCGLVAELGAMRVSEEIDAIEVMGVHSIAFLVSTRVAAHLTVLPLLFVTSLGVHFLATRLFFVDILGAVSEGGFTSVLFLMQGPDDLAIAVFWGTLVGFVITVVSCFYGYNASGGPVGVGYATAQAMLVNLVLISMIAAIMAQIFYAGTFSEAFGT